jgi:hypothetical protein
VAQWEQLDEHIAEQASIGPIDRCPRPRRLADYFGLTPGCRKRPRRHGFRRCRATHQRVEQQDARARRIAVSSKCLEGLAQTRFSSQRVAQLRSSEHHAGCQQDRLLPAAMFFPMLPSCQADRRPTRKAHWHNDLGPPR